MVKIVIVIDDAEACGAAAALTDLICPYLRSQRSSGTIVAERCVRGLTSKIESRTTVELVTSGPEITDLAAFARRIQRFLKQAAKDGGLPADIEVWQDVHAGEVSLKE